MVASPPRPRVVVQRRLDGKEAVLVLRGSGGRTRTEEVAFDSLRKAAAAVRGAMADDHAARVVMRGEGPETATCPKCGFQGAVTEHFGTRVLRGRRLTQSWCLGCRGGKSPGA